MIKVKLYTEENYWKDSYKNIEYDDNVFFDLMNGEDNILNVNPPFRDQESTDFLMKTHRICFLEDDWYSIIWNERRTSLAALSQSLRYGLTVINYSRNDTYLSYVDADDKVWNILSQMPFDIFISLKAEDIEKYQLFGEEEFLIMNYSLGEKYIEVLVRNDDFVFDKQRYKCVLEQMNKDMKCGLYMDEDGKYYINKWNLEDIYLCG